MDLMTTFSQGKLSRSFTIRYLLDGDTLYFALINRKTRNDLGNIVSTSLLKMKFLIVTREIITIKEYQKQAQ